MKPTNFTVAVLVTLFATVNIATGQTSNDQTKAELYIQTMHTSAVAVMTATPDGRLLASAGWDGTVKLWDIASSRELRTWKGFSRTQSLLRFSPDGNLLAISRGDNKILIFDVNTEKPQLEIQTVARINYVFFTPDSSWLISIGGPPDERKIWNVADGKEIILKDAQGSTHELYILNEDATVLVTTHASGYRVWDGVRKKELTKYRRLNFKGRLRVTRSGKYLAAETLHKNTSVKVWDLQSAKLIFQGKCGELCELEFTQDEKALLITEYEKLPKLVDLSRGIARTVYDAVLSNDMSYVRQWYLKELAGIALKDLDKLKRLSDLKVTPKIAYEPSHNLLALSCEDCQEIKVVDVVTKREIKIKLAQTTADSLVQTVKALSFSPGSNILMVRDGVVDSSTETRIMLWKIERQNKNISATVLNDDFFMTGYAANEIYSPAISPNNRYIACFTTKNILVWDLESTTVVRVFNDVRWVTLGPSPIMWFSPDSNILIVSVWSGMLLLNIRDGNEVPLGGHDFSKSFSQLAFDSKSRLLAGIQRKRTSIYDEIYEPIYAADPVDPSGPKPPIKGEIIKVWDVASGELITTIETHSTSISSIAFSNDGKRLISMGNSYDNKIVELWNAETGGFLYSLPADASSTRQEVINLAPNFYEKSKANDPGSATFMAERGENGKIKLLNRKTNDEIASIIVFGNANSWVVSMSDGFFDTNADLENADGLRWKFPNEALKQYPIEIFMRDYYEPRLLPSMLTQVKLPDQPRIQELNKIQPKIEKISVSAQKGKSDLVDVTVQVSSVAGECLRNGNNVPCESGVYDLRLYRDRQLVKQFPAADLSNTNFTAGKQEQVRKWRDNSVVRTKAGNPVSVATGAQEITFTDIRLPRRAGVSQVKFTAYAFNGDRVKSATSNPTVFQLPQPRPGKRPRAFLVMVGVDVTSDPSLRLGFAPTGAQEIGKFLRQQLEPEIDVVNISLISEYKKDAVGSLQALPTKNNLGTILNVLSGTVMISSEGQLIKPQVQELQTATPDDLVVVYIASHGYADPSGKFYVIPSDISESSDVDSQSLDRCLKTAEQSSKCQSAREFLKKSISSDELAQWLQAIDAGQLVLILDSCHSEAVSGPGFRPGPMGDPGFGQLSYDKGMLVLAATQSENLAWGPVELDERSLLTYALTQPQTTGEIFDLRQWLRDAVDQVPKLYDRFIKLDQQPRSLRNQQVQRPVLFDFSKRHVSKKVQR